MRKYNLLIKIELLKKIKRVKGIAGQARNDVLEGIKFLVRKGEHRPTEKLLERKGLPQD